MIFAAGFADSYVLAVLLTTGAFQAIVLPVVLPATFAKDLSVFMLSGMGLRCALLCNGKHWRRESVGWGERMRGGGGMLSLIHI